MSKAVLLPIWPKWCELIASGEKTIEVRKTRPKQESPFKCFIYCTKPSFPHEDFFVFDAGTGKAKAFYGGGKVIGEFVCDRVFDIEFDEDEGYNETYTPLGFHDCLTDEEFDRYLGAKAGAGWHISDLVIYDEPKKLSDFRLYNTSAVIEHGLPMPTHEIRRPPQSWCYVEESV